jgi:NarL family two-component system sensor histidine kinase LiaS
MAVSEERNRLARELHDSAKQQALAASFQIGAALTLFERDPQAAKTHLAEAEYLVDSVREELTDLIAELRPQALDEKKLDEILGEYTEDWSHQNPISVNLDLQENIQAPLIVKQTLLRVLQEALANVARHSDAETVSLTLQSEEQVVKMIVRDDGNGFSREEVTGGMGLHSMKERAESLAGSLLVISTRGAGTSVEAVIPLGNEMEQS